LASVDRLVSVGKSIDTERSLNAGVSSRKDSSAPDLGEQVHKIRDRSRIKLRHNLDEPVSPCCIGAMGLVIPECLLMASYLSGSPA